MASLTSNHPRTIAGRTLVLTFSLLLLLTLSSFALLFAQKPQLSSQKLQSNHTIAPFFEDSVQYWNEDIQRWALEFDLDPNLIATVIQIESCGDPTVSSSAGAMGLFQVMPFHFYPGEDPFEPQTNALRGLNYLNQSLLAAKNDPVLAMAGYNGGIGVIELLSTQWYDETQRYVYWGFRLLQDAEAGLAYSAAYEEWYVSYGYWMCQNAKSQLGLLP